MYLFNILKRGKLFAVATLFVASQLIPLVALSDIAIADANGNNGTLKVHELNTPSGTESNDPKVCAFNFEGFGFDVGQSGYIRIEGQGQTSGTYGDYSFGPTVANPTHTSYAESQYFNNGGVVIPDGHYKATFYGKDTGGSINLADDKAKSKVFKIECGEPETGKIEVKKEVNNGQGFVADNPSAYGFKWGINQEPQTREFGTTTENLNKDDGPFLISENTVAGYKYVGWYDGNNSCENPDGTEFPSVAIRADQTRRITLCNEKIEEKPALPYVRISYICQADFTGKALAWTGSVNEVVDVTAGDHIWRFRYESANSDSGSPSTVSYSTNFLGMGGDIDKDQILFETTSTGQNGVNVSTVPGPNKYSGTAGVSGADCERLEEPTLGVTKRVINDDLGQNYAIDFKMFVNGERVNSPRKGGGELEDNQVTHHFEGSKAGVEYVISEENKPGYEPSAVSCVDTANNNAVVPHPVTLEYGQRVECTIVNNDIPQGSLTLFKNVVNNWNGPKSAEDFVLTIHDSKGGLVDYQKSGVQIILEAGWYNVGEIQQDGYVTSGWDWWNKNCTVTGWVYISSGSNKECTITNYDLPGKIVVHKEVVNNNGGEKRAKDFRFKVDHNGKWQNFNHSGVNYVLVDAGLHSVYEDEHYAYRTSYDGCRHIYVKNGETKHCYITNNDRAPEVKVIKWTDPLWSEQDFDFDINVDGELYDSFTIDANRFDDKVATKYETSYDFQAGMVEIVESPTEGWDHLWTQCYKETRQGLQYVGHPFEAEVGKEYICKVKNEQRGSVIVTKFNDQNQNGYMDEDEEALPDWEITLDGMQECEISEVNDSVVAALQREDNNKECEQTEEVNLQQTTDENGKTVFENLKSGLYMLDEVEQDGWEKRNIYCISAEKFIGTLNDNQVLEFDLENGMNLDCYVGNYQTPDIDITVTPVCEDDFPYLQWTVKTTNVVPTQFTLDWYTVSGNDNGDPADVLAGTQTFDVSEANFDGIDTYTATTDWLGSDPSVPDWPGWESVNGVWEQDPTDLGGNTRPSARVEFTVNPSDDVEVNYPPATPACDPNPDQPGQVLAATTSATPVTLATTGSGVQSGIIVGLLLIGAVAFTRRRHTIASRN